MILYIDDDETGGPAFFWTNPWNGKREKLGNLWWPEHPPEATKDVEHLLANASLHIPTARASHPAMTFEIGSVVRFGDGPTALMEITSFSEGRAYGDHALGGSVGAEIADVRPPSDEDMRVWHRECGRGK
jgi:hypothetical protein